MLSTQSDISTHFETMTNNGAGIISTPDSWYCPSCGYGPHNPHLDVGCANCGYIPRRKHRQQAHSVEPLTTSTLPIAYATIPVPIPATAFPTTEASEHICFSLHQAQHSLRMIPFTSNDGLEYNTTLQNTEFLLQTIHPATSN